jgi:hypothetical protein
MRRRRAVVQVQAMERAVGIERDPLRAQLGPAAELERLFLERRDVEAVLLRGRRAGEPERGAGERQPAPHRGWRSSPARGR